MSNQIKMSDLNSCPFCGKSKLALIKDSVDALVGGSGDVLCLTCGSKARLHKWNVRFDKIVPSDFIEIETYEDCPCDTNLCVWTGDSYEVEYVDMDPETGSYYPANGIEFTHYIELPDSEAMQD